MYEPIYVKLFRMSGVWPFSSTIFFLFFLSRMLLFFFQDDRLSIPSIEALKLWNFPFVMISFVNGWKKKSFHHLLCTVCAHIHTVSNHFRENESGMGTDLLDIYKSNCTHLYSCAKFSELRNIFVWIFFLFFFSISFIYFSLSIFIIVFIHSTHTHQFAK